MADDRYTIPTGPTADEVLYALNGCQPVPLRSIGWTVITGTHTPAENEPAWPFTPGQLLVTLDGHVFPDGPDLDAWHTSAHCAVRNIAEAMDLAELVRSGPERGVCAWSGSHWSWPADQQQAMAEYASVGDREGFAFVGDTDADNTWGADIRYPGRYTWPATPEKDR